MTTIEDIRAIVESSDSEYNHEMPETLRSKEFNKVYRKYVKDQIKPYGYELVNCGDGYCECSGFVTNGQNYVYFNSGDYRMSAPYCDVFDYVLVRTAANDKDYHGGPNNYCNLKNLGAKIAELMEK